VAPETSGILHSGLFRIRGVTVMVNEEIMIGIDITEIMKELIRGTTIEVETRTCLHKKLKLHTTEQV